MPLPHIDVNGLTRPVQDVGKWLMDRASQIRSRFVGPPPPAPPARRPVVKFGPPAPVDRMSPNQEVVDMLTRVGAPSPPMHGPPWPPEKFGPPSGLRPMPWRDHGSDVRSDMFPGTEYDPAFAPIAVPQIHYGQPPATPGPQVAPMPSWMRDDDVRVDPVLTPERPLPNVQSRIMGVKSVTPTSVPFDGFQSMQPYNQLMGSLPSPAPVRAAPQSRTVAPGSPSGTPTSVPWDGYQAMRKAPVGVRDAGADKRSVRALYAQLKGNPSAPEWAAVASLGLEKIMSAYDDAQRFEGRPEDPSARWRWKITMMRNLRLGWVDRPEVLNAAAIAEAQPVDVQSIMEPMSMLRDMDEARFGGMTRGSREVALSLYRQSNPNPDMQEFSRLWAERQDLAEQLSERMEEWAVSSESIRNEQLLRAGVKELMSSNRGLMQAVEIGAGINPVSMLATLTNNRVPGSKLGENAARWVIQRSGGVKDMSDDSDEMLIARSLVTAMSPVSTAMGLSTGRMDHEQPMFLRTAAFIGDIGAGALAGGVGAAAGASLAASAASARAIARAALTSGIAVHLGNQTASLMPVFYEAGNGDFREGASQVGLAVTDMLSPQTYADPNISWGDKALMGMTAAMLLFGLGYGARAAWSRARASVPIDGPPPAIAQTIAPNPASKRHALREIDRFLKQAVGKASADSDSLMGDYAELMARIGEMTDATNKASARYGSVFVGGYIPDYHEAPGGVAIYEMVREAQRAHIDAIKGGNLDEIAETMKKARDLSNAHAQLMKLAREAGPDEDIEIMFIAEKRAMDTEYAQELLVALVERERAMNRGPLAGVRGLARNAATKIGRNLGLKPALSGMFGPGNAMHELLTQGIEDQVARASALTHAVANAARKWASGLPFANDAQARAIMQEYGSNRHAYMDLWDESKGTVSRQRFDGVIRELMANGVGNPEELMRLRLEQAGYSPERIAVLAPQIQSAVEIGSHIMNQVGHSASVARALLGEAEVDDMLQARNYGEYWSSAYESQQSARFDDSAFIGRSPDLSPGVANPVTRDAAASKTRGATIGKPFAVEGAPAPGDGIDTIIGYVDSVASRTAYAPASQAFGILRQMFGEIRSIRDKATMQATASEPATQRRARRTVNVVHEGESLKLSGGGSQGPDDAILGGIASNLDVVEGTLRQLHESVVGARDVSVLSNIVSSIAGNVLAFRLSTIVAQGAAAQNLAMVADPGDIMRGLRLASAHVNGELDEQMIQAGRFIDSQTTALVQTGAKNNLRFNEGESFTSKISRFGRRMIGRGELNSPARTIRHIGMQPVQATQALIDRTFYWTFFSEGMRHFNNDIDRAAVYATRRFTDVFPRVRGFRSPLYDNHWTKPLLAMTGEPFYQALNLMTESGRAVTSLASKSHATDKLRAVGRLTSMLAAGYAYNAISKSLTGNSYSLIDPAGDIAESNAALDGEAFSSELISDARVLATRPLPRFRDEFDTNNLDDQARQSVNRTMATLAGNMMFGSMILGVWKDIDRAGFAEATLDTQASGGNAFITGSMIRSGKAAVKGVKRVSESASVFGTDQLRAELLREGLVQWVRAGAIAAPGGSQLSGWAIASQYMAGEDVGSASAPNVRSGDHHPFQDLPVWVGGASQSVEAREARAKRLRNRILGLN